MTTPHSSLLESISPEMPWLESLNEGHPSADGTSTIYWMQEGDRLHLSQGGTASLLVISGVLNTGTDIGKVQALFHWLGALEDGPMDLSLEGKGAQAMVIEWPLGLPILDAGQTASSPELQAFKSFQRPLPLSWPLQSCLQQVPAMILPQALWGLFLQAKALEILAQQWAAWLVANKTTRRHARSDYDIDRIQYARDYLLQHMSMPPSIVQLAEIAGINHFKLKNGFKELYGTTIFAWLAEERLRQAMELLQSGNITATEVAFQLGYSSLQHFSLRFKERFGLPPAAIRRLHLANDIR